MQGDEIVGNGGLFLSLLDGRNWTTEVALAPVLVSLEAARDRNQHAKRKVEKFDDVIRRIHEFERTKSMSALLDIRHKIERLYDYELIDVLRIVDLVLACAGYHESAAHVSQHLIMIATRGSLSSADRAYRIQQSLGWMSYAAGIYNTDDDYSAVPEIADIDLIAYRMAKNAAVSALDPRLLKYSMSITDEIVMSEARQHRTGEIAYIMPPQILGMDARWRWNGSSCENPTSAAGLSAQVIAMRHPSLAGSCDVVIQRPDDVGAIRELMSALMEHPANVREELEECTRLLALLGDRQGMLDGACFMMRRAYHETRSEDLKHGIEIILGLIAVASGARPVSDVERHREDGILEIAHLAGQWLVGDIRQSAVDKERRIKQRTADRDAIDADLVPDPAEADSIEEGHDKPVVATASKGSFLAKRGYVQVINSIGNPDSREGKSVVTEFEALMKPVKLLDLPSEIDLNEVREELIEEFPHAEAAIDTIIGDISARQRAGEKGIEIRPTLFVGAPGCGKSRLARRIAEALGLPHRMHPAAGIADAMFSGLSRGWHGGHACAPLDLMRSAKVANPALILDEIDKAGTGTRNGNLVDSLLPMIEPETAHQWTDQYVQAPVDLSHVNWFFTANDTSKLSSPFRDRVRIVEVPSPSLHHVTRIAKSIVAEMRPRGQRIELMPDLDSEEMQVLLEHWMTNMSIRALQRMIQALLAARDEIAPRH